MKKPLLTILIILLCWHSAVLAQPGRGLFIIQQPPSTSSPPATDQSSSQPNNRLAELLKDPQLAPVREFLIKIVTKQRESYRSMQQQLAQLHLETLLTRATLENRETIKQGRERAEQMIELINKYEIICRDALTEAETEAGNLTLPPELREQFLSGFRSGKTKNLQNFTEYFQIERAVGNLFLEILNFLESRQGHYQFDKEQMLFESQADLDHYDELIQRLLKLVQQERAILSEILQLRDENIKNVEKELNTTPQK